MNKFNSLSFLFIEELAYLLDSENQLAEILPAMDQASRSPALKSTLESCLEITREHVRRLRDIFSNVGQNPQNLTCKSMMGLVRECEDIVKKIEMGPARDAAMVNTAQRMQEYEIARYKSVREHAADLGHTKIVELLTKTLDEERAMNFYFNELAQGMINVQATDPSPGPKSGGFYIPEGKFKRKGPKKKSKGVDEFRFISEGNPNVQDQDT